MKTNQEYKNAALAVLNGNWAPVVVATIVMWVVSFILQLPTGFIDPTASTGAILAVFYGIMFLAMFITIPVTVGYYNALNKLYLDGDNNVTSNMFTMGFGRFLRYVGGMLLMGVYVVLSVTVKII